MDILERTQRSADVRYDRIRELEQAIDTTDTLYRQSRAKCEQLQGEIKTLKDAMTNEQAKALYDREIIL